MYGHIHKLFYAMMNMKGRNGVLRHSSRFGTVMNVRYELPGGYSFILQGEPTKYCGPMTCLYLVIGMEGDQDLQYDYREYMREKQRLVWWIRMCLVERLRKFVDPRLIVTFGHDSVMT